MQLEQDLIFLSFPFKDNEYNICKCEVAIFFSEKRFHMQKNEKKKNSLSLVIYFLHYSGKLWILYLSRRFFTFLYEPKRCSAST